MTDSRNIPEILKENIRRNAEMDSPFNPITGVGSLVPRKRLVYTDGPNKVDYMAPESMFKENIVEALSKAGDIKKLLESINGYSLEKHNKLSRTLYEIRLNHDFEFYCFTCVKIPEKIPDSESTGDLIPFKLNRSQRRLLSRLEKMRLANKPIRVILEKARQWGGSTEIQIYGNWIQFRHRKRWNMAICTLVNAQAAHIRNMLTRTIENFPSEIGKYTITPYAGTQTNKYIPERDCIIGVGSTQAPENLRTYNIHLLHASEVGSWKDTPEKSAKSLMQSLRGTIADIPYSMIAIESTPKGVGNFFYDEWVSAEKGISGYDAIFIPWFGIEMYRKPIDDMDKFITSLDEIYKSDGTTFWYLWELGATLEGINWYKDHKAHENLDDIGMMQEFPSTSEEGFSSTGRPAFNHIHIKRMERFCCPPKLKGELTSEEVKGVKAFDNIEFRGSHHGELWIWELPDTSIKMSNRYCAFADIGGRTSKADYSTVKVLDRYWILEGGIPEVVAVWKGHIDHDLFAWIACRIATFYNKALMAFETNTYDKDKSEANNFLTVVDEIASYYSNLYTRTSIEEIRAGIPNKYGFNTNQSTKPVLVSTLNAALRDELYYERDQRSLDEMYMFELKDDGKYGAKDSKKDDLVIATAGSLWLSLKYMQPPQIIKESETVRRNVVVSEASL